MLGGGHDQEPLAERCIKRIDDVNASVGIHALCGGECCFERAARHRGEVNRQHVGEVACEKLVLAPEVARGRL